MTNAIVICYLPMVIGHLPVFPFAPLGAQSAAHKPIVRGCKSQDSGRGESLAEDFIFELGLDDVFTDGLKIDFAQRRESPVKLLGLPVR